MAYAVQTSTTTTPLGILRNALDEAERLIVNVDAENIESLLVLFDTIDEMFETMSNPDIDMRPEEGRWQGLLSRLTSKPRPLARAAAAAGGMQGLRGRHAPAEDIWWHLDREAVRQSRQSIKRFVSGFGSIVLVLVLVIWGVNRFFPPDPDTVLMVETTSRIDELVLQQRWEEALAVVEEIQYSLPEEPELRIWESILSAKLGDDQRSATSLQNAQELYMGPGEFFWVVVGNSRLQAGEFDGAEEAARTAEAINPEAAQVFFLYGGIAEIRGDSTLAIEMFEKTFTLAEDDDPQLAVIAKVRMGQLMQQFNPFEGFETPEATPTPEP